jgi:hypothetical protein
MMKATSNDGATSNKQQATSRHATMGATSSRQQATSNKQACHEEKKGRKGKPERLESIAQRNALCIGRD